MKPPKTSSTPKRPARRKTDGQKNKQAQASVLGKSSIEEKDEAIIKPININASILKRCKQHAKELGIKTLKEYTENALLYFVKNGMNPCERLHSEEVSKEVVRTRNHIFSFLQKQEEQYVLPLYKEVLTQGKNAEQSVDTMLEQMEKMIVLLFRIQQMIHVSTSTMLHVSDLSAETIDEIKAKNQAFVETHVSEFMKKMESDQK
ncbi:BfmA/BtgA family mobilization protein [Cytophagaceae bacterium DM2B3-1]|uniref:BfmA/BtgA family mobilization protein n=1 Tax=Xanthocytophaga flava TaxID=3048013 RepID=A0AAE3U778_9BACT|nr:BfmA/BtgA family mobilization protein [Xanthocytophaga flavus]MDJ1482639.1 BfmA/BtgA family mobilization protein [Xanthocytophaga flavus]MDJ1493030.1 BfmA/BtgA family mobilization protein [Xanthocytophaga flavus]